MQQTEQETFWSGEFGQQYTDRNTRDRAEWDDFYRQNWGLTKSEMNSRFTADWSPETPILEVGCNTGMQLRGLQDAGFTNLYGIELQPYAVEKAKQSTQHINIVQGSGFDLPFRDAFSMWFVRTGPDSHCPRRSTQDYRRDGSVQSPVHLGI